MLPAKKYFPKIQKRLSQLEALRTLHHNTAARRDSTSRQIQTLVCAPQSPVAACGPPAIRYRLGGSGSRQHHHAGLLGESARVLPVPDPDRPSTLPVAAAQFGLSPVVLGSQWQLSRCLPSRRGKTKSGNSGLPLWRVRR